VKKGSFYHFFSSKSDLAAAAMDEHFRKDKPDLDTIFSPSLPPLERFERLIAYTLEEQGQAFEKYGRVCGCPFATLGCEIAGQNEVLREKTDEIF
jgi:TetR/AcrR family transcriptional repressor of nem operon